MVSIQPVNDQSDINFVCFAARNLRNIWVSHRGNAIMFMQSVWPADQEEFLFWDLSQTGDLSGYHAIFQDELIPIEIQNSGRTVSIVCEAPVSEITGEHRVLGDQASLRATEPNSLVKIGNLVMHLK
jgi:hypothetical protein